MILFTLFSSFLITAQPAATTQVPPMMYEFMGQMYRLQPLMFSTKNFSDKKNQPIIEETLSNLTKIAGGLPHNRRLSTASFQVSALALQDHLNELSSSFKDGRKEYARRLLLATLDGCSSCHTQVPGRNLPQWTFKESELKGDPFEKAEFLFAVRHYNEALKYYAAFIKDFDRSKGDVLHLETALRRILVIYIRVFRNPKEGIKVLQPSTSDTALPKHVRADMRGWIKGLNKLAKTPPPDAQKATVSEIETYARRMTDSLLAKKGMKYESENFVGYLEASGVIFDFMNSRPDKDLTAKLLLLLAQCDSEISQGYFFSMTENYLKECIERFPTDPTAKLCYEELKAASEASYTGSSGTNMPDEISDELNRYKKLLKL